MYFWEILYASVFFPHWESFLRFPTASEFWWENRWEVVGKINLRFPTTSEIWWEMVGKRFFLVAKSGATKGIRSLFPTDFPTGKKKTLAVCRAEYIYIQTHITFTYYMLRTEGKKKNAF